MANTKKTMATKLNAAQIALSNTLADSEIQTLVAGFGYTPAKMAEGQALYTAALQKMNDQIAAAGAQQQATQNLVAAEKRAREAYQALAQVARAVYLKDPATLTMLGLSNQAPRNIAGLLAAGYTLFANAAKLETGALAGYGYPAAKLTSEQAAIAALDAANQAQQAAKGAAQQATQEQDAALQALQTWVAQYIKIARVALRQQKQLLEKIGVISRTGPTPAQRAARTKKMPAD